VEQADTPRHRRDVDRSRRIDGDEVADADRAVELGHRLDRQRGFDVHRMPGPSVVPGEGDLGGTPAVHLDRADPNLGEAGEPAALVGAVRPEVRLDDHVARAARQCPQQLHRGRAEPLRPGQVGLAVAGLIEHVVQRLLDHVLGDERVPELRGQRHGEACLSRAGGAGDVDEVTSHGGQHLMIGDRDGRHACRLSHDAHATSGPQQHYYRVVQPESRVRSSRRDIA
jgi:hypothetical protein